MVSGIVLLDKEEGMTSRKVDNLIGKMFLSKKVGHLGTLDPFATGLLLLAVGKATKFLPYLDSSFKTYVASLSLGVKTDTGDKDGKPVSSKSVPVLKKEKIDSALASFLGKSSQIPPMSSAIKIDGVPLYRLAHEGKERERAPREIEIRGIRCLSFDGSCLEFEAEVSSGTYVRTLGEDIAEKLGTVGHLTSLRRVKVGEIPVEKAKRLSELEERDFLPPSLFLSVERVPLGKGLIPEVKNGKKILLEGTHEEEVALMDGEEALAIYQKGEDGLYHCKRGLF